MTEPLQLKHKFCLADAPAFADGTAVPICTREEPVFKLAGGPEFFSNPAWQLPPLWQERPRPHAKPVDLTYASLPLPPEDFGAPTLSNTAVPFIVEAALQATGTPVNY